MAPAVKTEKGKGQKLKDIVAPHQHDVLCGRGGGTNNHVGNELFRQMVNQKKRVYLNSCKRDKPAVSRGIVQAIRNLDPPGRFLQRNETTGMWYDIGDQKAREKTSQALREGAPEIRKSLGGPPSPPAVTWHEGQTPSLAAVHHDPYYGNGPPGKLSSRTRSSSSASYSPPSRSAYLPHSSAHYYHAPPYDPHGRQYSITSTSGGPPPPRLQDSPVSHPTPRPGSAGSTLPSHITPEAAKALLQFLKAQQAKAETDPNAASTAIGSHELATALAAATSSSGLEDAPPSPGRVAAIAAELEALAEARSHPPPERIHSRVVSSAPSSRPTSGQVFNSDLAHSIAAAAGISPQAANIALQLATRAKDASLVEEERGRSRQLSRRAREEEFYSRDHSSPYMAYTSSFDSSRYEPYQPPQEPRKSITEPPKSSKDPMPTIEDPMPTPDIPEGPSLPPIPTEVERRLAVAEHMAQLARSGARVVTDESLARKDREMTLLSKKTAMFQDLGILGVKLSVIQYALANGSSLEELLRESQQAAIKSSEAHTEVNNNPDNESTSQDNHMPDTPAEQDLNLEQVLPNTVNEQATQPEEPQYMQVDAVTADAMETQAGNPSEEKLIESENNNTLPSQSPSLPIEGKDDSMFPRDMVKSALDAMGADISVS